MRKIATILIALFIFSLLSTFSLSAAVASETNNSDSPVKASDEQKDENADSDANSKSEDNGEDTENDVQQDVNEDASLDDSNEAEENDSSSLPGSEPESHDSKNEESDDDGKDDASRSDDEVTPVQEEKQQDSSTEVNEKEQKAEIHHNQIRTFSTSAAKIGSKTSRLGHVRSTNVRIYEVPGGDISFSAGEKYINAVYYIKKQANVDGVKYFLISKEPSSVNGVVGWVKATDLSTHTHKGVNKQKKTLYFSGKGSAYTKAWGGSKDLVYQDMSPYKSQAFHIHLTERVGNNTWYRGNFNGKTIWLHESYLTGEKPSIKIEKSRTSKLGHIRSAGVKIYKTIGNGSTAFTAGDKYTDQVYYIKQQAKANGQTYYLISLQPSHVNGVVGWVKATDLSTHAHKGVDKQRKTLYFTGKGSAYTKAWGGSKDMVYQDMSKYKGQRFNIHLTETVGNNTWYRGNFNGKTIWLHESYLATTEESHTSRLGHLHSSAKIYKKLGDESSLLKTGEYINAVYYIKQQAKVNDQTYYLISKQPSRKDGVVGWVKAGDLSTHDHLSADKKDKVFYFSGKGSAYTKAWGGSKDLVYHDMSKYKGQKFSVHLTETVGSNTWYRGNFNGKTIWLHESYLTEHKNSYTSRLGHIRRKNVKIYKNIMDKNASSFIAGKKYTNQVYYIKKKMEMNDHTYYLISHEPSSKNGVIGWVDSKDLSTHAHLSVDKKNKLFTVKGKGNAYSKAWGGSKDLIYDASQFKGQEFSVHLTEKVGDNIWYRGTLNGKTVWFHESYLQKAKEVVTTHTNYDLTLNKMVDIQMKVNPQTDKQYKLWIREDAFSSIHNGIGAIDGDYWNLRRGPGTNYQSGGKVSDGTKLTLLASKRVSGYTWYHVRYTSGWVTPDATDVSYYLDYTNFTDSLKNKLQFLKLSESASINVAEVNGKILKGKGVLEGKAQSFVEGGKVYGVNEIYLIAHALLETGNGTSKLASGIKYNGKTVYNMYGVGANDSCPLECGAKYAYNAGWFTPEAAIIGGTEFVGNNYLQAGQDTLYKMRWNPAAAVNFGYATHQYATDIGWAFKQTSRMYTLYNLLDGYSLLLDIPKYK